MEEEWERDCGEIEGSGERGKREEGKKGGSEKKGEGTKRERGIKKKIYGQKGIVRERDNERGFSIWHTHGRYKRKKKTKTRKKMI